MCLIGGVEEGPHRQSSKRVLGNFLPQVNSRRECMSDIHALVKYLGMSK